MTDTKIYSTGSVQLVDDTLPDPQMVLRYQPYTADAGTDVATVEFQLDLGVVGSGTVVVTVPTADLLAWADAARAAS